MIKVLLMLLVVFSASSLHANEVNYDACSTKIVTVTKVGKYFYDDSVVRIYGIKPLKNIKYLDGLVSPSKKANPYWCHLGQKNSTGCNGFDI